MSATSAVVINTAPGAIARCRPAMHEHGTIDVMKAIGGSLLVADRMM
jgi:hypothetical protein